MSQIHPSHCSAGCGKIQLPRPRSDCRRRVRLQRNTQRHDRFKTRISKCHRIMGGGDNPREPHAIIENASTHRICDARFHKCWVNWAEHSHVVLFPLIDCLRERADSFHNRIINGRMRKKHRETEKRIIRKYLLKKSVLPSRRLICDKNC